MQAQGQRTKVRGEAPPWVWYKEMLLPARKTEIVFRVLGTVCFYGRCEWKNGEIFIVHYPGWRRFAPDPGLALSMAFGE